MTGLNVLWGKNSDAGQLTGHFRFLEHLEEKMVSDETLSKTCFTFTVYP